MMKRIDNRTEMKSGEPVHYDFSLLTDDDLFLFNEGSHFRLPEWGTQDLFMQRPQFFLAFTANMEYFLMESHCKTGEDSGHIQHPIVTFTYRPVLLDQVRRILRTKHDRPCIS